jgi:trehalose utilization protein
VSDQTVDLIVDRVNLHGLGFIALHSSHYSRPFKEILQATGHLRGGWDETGGPEEIRVCSPGHPIAEGIEDFVLPEEEYYGAPFDIPPPETVVFQSHFPKKGRYFPSGLTWTVGEGKNPDGPITASGQGEGIGRVFYFRPGHETLPTFLDPNVQRILTNAVLWAAKRVG